MTQPTGMDEARRAARFVTAIGWLGLVTSISATGLMLMTTWRWSALAHGVLRPEASERLSPFAKMAVSTAHWHSLAWLLLALAGLSVSTGLLLRRSWARQATRVVILVGISYLVGLTVLRLLVVHAMLYDEAVNRSGFYAAAAIQLGLVVLLCLPAAWCFRRLSAPGVKDYLANRVKDE